MALQPGITLDENCTVDAILLQIEPCILALTRSIAYSDLSDWERDEIAQLVWIKLARVLPEKRIVNLPAYLRTTVRNEVISYLRQRKLFRSLMVSEDGEIHGGTVLVSPSQGMDDPQIEIERNTLLIERLNQLVEAILTLPTVQKKAIICLLRERMDDPSLLIDVFMQYHIDITTTVWPIDRMERQKLQASCSVARQTLARRLNIDLSLYGHRRVACICRSPARKAKRSRKMLPIVV